MAFSIHNIPQFRMLEGGALSQSNRSLTKLTARVMLMEIKHHSDFLYMKSSLTHLLREASKG